MRKNTAIALHRETNRSHRRRRSGGWTRHYPSAGPSTGTWNGVSELCAVSAHDRGGEWGLRSAHARHGDRRGTKTYRGGARPAANAGPRTALSRTIVRRAAAARRIGAL